MRLFINTTLTLSKATRKKPVTIMRTLFCGRCKVSQVSERLTIAPDSSHHHKRARLFLLLLFICVSILAALISTEWDMMLVGTFLEPHWTATLRRSPAQPSSFSFLPLGQELWIHEATTTLEQIKEDTGRAACHIVLTHRAHIFGLPSPVDEKPVQLTAGPTHKLSILSYDIDGKSRCAGGDYFETDLSSGTWKSRPPVIDLANGSYHLLLQVEPQHSGLFVLQITLAFGNFQGFVWSQEFTRMPTWRGEEVLKMEIEFIRDAKSDRLGPPALHDQQATLHRCNASQGHFDFQRWAGRWTRKDPREECPVDASGRYRCLDLDTECQSPWCEGPLGRLESNGWVYSAHCSFKIFTEEETWTCLDGKWLLFWGDSNHQDSIRNLLSFVLGFPMFNTFIDRRFDKTFYRNMTSINGKPPKPTTDARQQQSLRITNIYNGHQHENSDGQGLWSLSDANFRSLTERYFDIQQSKTPDVVILNSGLHDAIYWKTPFDYLNVGVELAINFWENIFASQQPLVIYRHTVATAGVPRTAIFNPSKVEWYTRVLGERFAKLKIENLRIVDDFDITFPWHFDLRSSDDFSLF